MIKKQDLPTKICKTCRRPFLWRKKWSKVWDEVRYCSEKCKRNKTVENIEKNQDNFDLNTVIEMAWCDKTSFESIKIQTGLLEKDVIKIMRSNLKKQALKFGEREFTHVKLNTKNYQTIISQKQKND